MSVVVKGMEMPTNCLRNMRRIESPLGTGGQEKMPDCQHCKYAELDYDDFHFGGHVRHWFLTGCKKDVDDVEKCEEFEEATREENPNTIQARI